MRGREALEAIFSCIGERAAVFRDFRENSMIVRQGLVALSSGFLKPGEVASAKHTFRFIKNDAIKQPAECGDVLRRRNGDQKMSGCGRRCEDLSVIQRKNSIRRVRSNRAFFLA